MNESVSRNGRDEKRAVTPLRDMKPEQIFAKMGHLQRLLDRFLATRPTGLAKISRMVLVAVYPVVRESFQLYGDICEVLAVLLDKFFDMEYPDCVKAFDAYASAAKQIDELVGFMPGARIRVWPGLQSIQRCRGLELSCWTHWRSL
ncbi:Putative clathrin assembly protein [Prunus dulcis]|uniref:Clathrin assembly protein n=1 Tax=Prunus dulcis TaxID=3755 RepID=A0A4Y1QUP3_PRUDU|nr:Putative clathrin assembly protein [Prunus dulcis]